MSRQWTRSAAILLLLVYAARPSSGQQSLLSPQDAIRLADRVEELSRFDAGKLRECRAERWDYPVQFLARGAGIFTLQFLCAGGGFAGKGAYYGEGISGELMILDKGTDLVLFAQKNGLSLESTDALIWYAAWYLRIASQPHTVGFDVLGIPGRKASAESEAMVNAEIETRYGEQAKEIAEPVIEGTGPWTITLYLLRFPEVRRAKMIIQRSGEVSVEEKEIRRNGQPD